MKTIYWISSALAVSAVAIAVWLSSGGALAAVWVQHFPATKLSAANKTKLANAVVCIAPTIPLADVERVRCWWIQPPKDKDGNTPPRELKCNASGVQTITADVYVQLLAAGKAGPYLSRTGDSVTVPASTGDLAVTTPCLTTWQTFTDSILPGQWDTLLSWFCARNPANATQIDCEADNAKTGTSTEYLDAGGGKEGGPALQAVIQ